MGASKWLGGLVVVMAPGLVWAGLEVNALQAEVDDLNGEVSSLTERAEAAEAKTERSRSARLPTRTNEPVAAMSGGFPTLEDDGAASSPEQRGPRRRASEDRVPFAEREGSDADREAALAAKAEKIRDNLTSFAEEEGRDEETAQVLRGIVESSFEARAALTDEMRAGEISRDELRESAREMQQATGQELNELLGEDAASDLFASLRSTGGGGRPSGANGPS